MAHGDYTGQTKQRLAHQFAEEQALAAQSKTLVTQVVREGQDNVIDLWTDLDDANLRRHVQQPKQDGSEGLEVIEVANEDPQYQPVEFRAAEDLDQITVGQGREFTLKAGRRYRAPRWVRDHLDAQGLVWHH